MKYTKDELLKILDKCIPIYKASNKISFHNILQNHCSYYTTNWDYYLFEKKDPDIIAKFDILRSIQEQKVIEGAMTGDYNPAFSMFLLKSKYKWCEEQHTRKLELEEKKLASQVQLIDTIESAINVNFTIAEHRSEEAINKLIDENK